MIDDLKCAAIILNYNDAENAILFADSIRDYTIIDHIIIVDNHSSDDSWQILKKYHNYKAHIIKTEKNGGYGFGNNFGINIAYKLYGCKIAFICNSDIQVDETCMQDIANILKENDSAAVCSAIQINGFTKEKIEASSWNVPTTFDYIRSSLMLLKRIIPEQTRIYKSRVEEVGCVAGAFLGVNVDKFVKMQGYDEEIFLFCEESVLGNRAKQNGYKTYLITDQKYYHYHSISINKSYPKEIAKYKIMLKSRRYYLMHYCNVKGIRLLGIDIVFLIAEIEQRIKLLLTAQK